MRRQALTAVLMLVFGATISVPVQAATISVSTFAGTGIDGPLVNDIPADTAQLWGPADVIVNVDGTAFIADGNHHQIRKVAADGIIHAALGTGVSGCDLSGGNVLWQPKGLATDAGGNVYVSNTLCGLVERLAPDGTVSVVAGHTAPNGNYTPVITDGMPATEAYLSQPAGLDFDEATGALYIADQYSQRILKVVAGAISVVAGTGTNGFSGDGGPATAAMLNYPRNVLASGGKLYISDSSNCRIRIVDATGIISTYAGTGSCSDSGDGGPASTAGLTAVTGLAKDGTGNLFVASGTSGMIRRIDATGVISTLTQFPGGLGGIAFTPSGDLLVAAGGASQSVFKITGLAAVIEPPPPAPLLKIVSLGDSVASGEGTRYRWRYVLDDTKTNGKNDVWNGTWVADESHPVWEPTSDPSPAVQNCHRSTDGYPYQVATSLGADLLNLSCSGASSDNGVLRHQSFGDGTQAALPQLGTNQPSYDAPNEAFDAAQPDVVLLTLGADDVKFGYFVERCYRSATSTKSVTRYCDTDQALNDEATSLLAAQKVALESVVTEILRRGQAAGKVPLIVLTTYYDPFPSVYKQCRDITPKEVLLRSFGLSSGEMAWLKSRLLSLNDNIRAVARSHPEAKLLDIESAFKGHEWCSRDPWIYGPSIMTQPGFESNPSPFHPTWYGQQILAEKVDAAIRQKLNLG